MFSNSRSIRLAAGVVAVGVVSTAAFAQNSARVTFDNGPEGWAIQGEATIEPDGGNPGAQMVHFQIDTFGVRIDNRTTPAFIGNYAAKGPVRLGLDIEVNRIWMEFSGDVPRDLVVELRDYDNPPGNYPYVSVWYNLGTLVSNSPWQTLAVGIEDPTSVVLPPGWGGTGDEDPNTFEPRLPPGRTFANVLTGVDEVVFTTFVPGFFFGFTNFDFGVDNIFIEPLGGTCEADFNNDGTLDFFDYLDFAVAFDAEDASADFDRNSIVDFFDYLDFVAAIDAGC